MSRFSMNWIPPIMAYCTASICMTLTNKLVLSGFQYKMAFLMLGVQLIVGFPISLLMAVMLYTGSKSLQFLSVPVFTIFKNLSIILVAYGEVKVFGGVVTRLMLFSFLLMVFSSIIAAQDDFSSSKSDSQKSDSFWGYFWMILNCISSAVFVIFMRYTIRKSGPNVVPFKDFDTVFYNNILTAPIFFILSLLGADGNLSEFIGYYSDPENMAEKNRFIFALLFSGISAFWISYASSWCMRVVNSTTYSMVGSLNKLPIAISGLIFFPEKNLTFGSIGSIILGFLSGLVYTHAKLKHDEESRKKGGDLKPLFDGKNKSEEEVIDLEKGPKELKY